MVSAAIIVAIYLAVIVWLMADIATGPSGTDKSGAFKKEEWDQILVLLTAIGTIATGAAGVLIGVQVQQGIVSAANTRAARSEVEAEAAKQDKKNVQATVQANLPVVNKAKRQVKKAAAASPEAKTASEALEALEEELKSALTL